MPEQALRLASVIELGQGSAPLHYLLAQHTQPSLRARLLPVGNTLLQLQLSLDRLPIGLPPEVTMATAGDEVPATQRPLLERLRQPMLLALHEARHHALACSLVRLCMPAVLAWPHEAPSPGATYLEVAVARSAAPLGLGRHRLFATGSAGRQLCDAMLVRADVGRQQAAATPRLELAIDDVVVTQGAWPVERHAGAEWRWTGPGPTCRILLPPRGDGRWRLTVFLFGSKLPLEAETISVMVDGRRMKVRFLPEYLKFECDIAGTAHDAACVEVQILQRSLWTTEDGSRTIGLALHKLVCEDLA